jgi:hypothetical protein
VLVVQIVAANGRCAVCMCSGGFKVDGRDNPTWCLNPQYCLTANTAGEPQVVVKVCSVVCSVTLSLLL